jgi:hypothetical protein
MLLLHCIAIPPIALQLACRLANYPLAPAITVKELVEKLLLILDKQEQQIIEQRVKVKGLALQLNDIVDFLNDYRAQEEKITMRWQNK